MLTTSTRLKLQNICQRVALDFVSAEGFISKNLQREMSVSSWVSRAQRYQQKGSQNGIDGLITDLDLDRRQPENCDKPEDDLGDWFSNASPWLRRD